MNKKQKPLSLRDETVARMNAVKAASQIVLAMAEAGALKGKTTDEIKNIYKQLIDETFDKGYPSYNELQRQGFEEGEMSKEEPIPVDNSDTLV